MRKTFLIPILFITLTTFGQKNAADMHSLNEGVKAPDITGVDTMGVQIYLDKVSSPYTLVYFYDFGCNHCDSILPKLVKVYDDYKKSGLEIFAVPMRRDLNQWKELIRKYKLTWINVLLSESDLSKLRKDYLLYSTPTLYLLDKKKKVISKRLVVIDDVESALKKHLH